MNSVYDRRQKCLNNLFPFFKFFFVFLFFGIPVWKSRGYLQGRQEGEAVKEKKKTSEKTGDDGGRE